MNMKRILGPALLSTLLLLPLSASAQLTGHSAPAAAPAAPTAVSTIAVEQAPLRSRASAFGRPITSLPFGSSVSILAPSTIWVQVRTDDGTEGYLHNSALASARSPVRLGGAGLIGNNGSVGGVVLAGKGLGGEVALEDRALPYNQVDALEGRRMTDDRLQNFLSQGGL